MKYKCLVLDHDDTVVASTAQIHYPSFVEFLKIIRPGVSITFEEYMYENFNPGFNGMCYGRFGFTEQEMKSEVEFWKEYVKKHVPVVYSGIRDILNLYKRQGGVICVVSHSLAENIKRDYEENNLPRPDMIFGWEFPNEQRKPSKYPIEQIMKHFNFTPSDLLVVDDLKPGCDMAQKCGVDFAAVGWSCSLPEIETYMRANSKYYLKTVSELEKIIY